MDIRRNNVGRHKAFLVTVATLFFSTLSPCFAQTFIDQATSLGITETTEHILFGSGVSTIDFNNDNLDDITLANNFGEIIFYQNTGTSFEQVDFDVLAPGNTKHVLWVDYDNDLDKDILITTNARQIVLYQNNGDFSFTNVTEQAGLPIYHAVYTGASFGDYDADGDLDLYLGKYVHSVENPTDSIHYNRLYRNEGDGTFTDVTVSSGIIMDPTLTFQPVWFDYNGDQFPELFVINDRSHANFLFLNLGDGQFEEIAADVHIGLAGEDIMSNSMADFDHDGDLDIFMTNTGAINSNSRSKFAIANDDLTYTESGVDYNIGLLEYGWGALWIDADNDSWEDLLFVTQFEDPIYFFENEAGTTFTQNLDEISVSQNHMSYSPASCDINNDGYADVVIQCELPHHPYVLVNEGGENHFIKITLEGTFSNRDAIGCWIRVFANDDIMSKYTFSGHNYLGQDSQHHIFGLGPNIELVDSVVVSYQSGHRDTYYNLPVDSSYHFQEGETYLVDISSGETSSFCEGDSLLLDAGVHENYLWEDDSSDQLRWVFSSGTYSIEVINEYGITAHDSIVVTTFENPSLSFENIHPLCSGDSNGHIIVSNLNAQAADSVVWNNGANGLENSNLSAGEYVCTYYDSNGCVGSGITSLVEPSELQIFLNTTPETDGNSDGTISILVFGGTPAYTILVNEEEEGQSIENLIAGDYLISITDENGCSLDTIATVDHVLDTKYHSNNQVRIFPNPTTDKFTIKTNEKLERVAIYDLSGALILESFEPLTNTLSIEHLPAGTYILNILFNNGTETQISLMKK